MNRKAVKSILIMGVVVVAVFAGFKPPWISSSDSVNIGKENNQTQASSAERPISAESFPGWQMWDISDYKNADPWTESTKLKTLPIFENNLPDIYEGYKPTDKDLAEMKAIVRELAHRLDMDMETLRINEGQWTAEEIESMKADFASRGESIDDEYFNSTAIHAMQNGVKILVQANKSASVEFRPELKLPEKYQWGYGASYEDTVATTAYLAERFEKLIAMEKPIINVNGGYHTKLSKNLQEKYGSVYVPNYSMSVYEGAGDIELWDGHWQ